VSSTRRGVSFRISIPLPPSSSASLKTCSTPTATPGPEAQGRAIGEARNGVLSALAALEQAAAKLEDERGLLAWIEPVPAEGSVDPHGGRLTHSGALAAGVDQVRTAIAALAAGEESRKPEPGPEPSWIEKRLAARAQGGWGG
jgi:hypothetical protein